MSDPQTSKETRKLLGSSKQTYEFLEWKDSLEDLCKSNFAENDLWKLFVYGTEPEDQQLATLIDSLNLYAGKSDTKYNKAKLDLIIHCDKRKEEKRIKLFIWIWGKVDESSQKGIKSSAVYKPIYDEASRTVDIIGLLWLLYNYHNCDLVAEGANRMAADDRYRNMNKMGPSETLRDFKTRHDNALNPYLASLSTEEERAKFKSSGDSKLRLLRKLSDSYKEFGATEQFKNSSDLEEIFAEAEKWYQYRVLVGIAPKDNSNPKKPDSIVGATLTPNLLKKIQNEAIQTHMAKSGSEITGGVTLDTDKKNKKNKKNKKIKETDDKKPGDKKPEPAPSALKICDLCKAAREATGDKSINFSNHASKNCFRLKHWNDVSAFVGCEDAFVDSADTDDSISEENDYIIGKNEVLMLDDEDFETPFRKCKTDVKKKNPIDRFVTCPNTGKRYLIPPNADNIALLEKEIVANEHLRENRWRTSYPEQAMIWDKHVQKVRASLPLGTRFPENLILDFDYIEPINALRDIRRSTGTAYQSPIVGKDYIPDLKNSDPNPLMDSLMLKGDNLMLEQNNIFLNLRTNVNSPILQISPEGKVPFSQPSDKVEMRGIRDSRKVKYNSVLDSKESRTIDLHSQESGKRWTCKCGEANTGPVCQLCYSQNPLRQLQSKFPSERVSLSNSITVSNSNIKQKAADIASSFWSNVDYDLNSADDIYLLNSVTKDIESNLVQLESTHKLSNQETNLFSALKVDENEDESSSLISVTSSSDSTPNSSKSTSTVLSAVLQKKTERLADSTQDELNKLIEYCDSILEFFKAKDPKSREYTASLRIKAALIDLLSDIPLGSKDLADSDYFKDIACPVSEFIRKTKPKSNRIRGEKRFTYFREKKWRKLYGMVIWDTGTVNHMFHSSMVKLVERIRKLDEARIFHGVGGSITVTESGDLKILKNIFFAENTPRNLVSQGQLVDEGFDIEYNKHNDCFIAEKDDFKLLFVREGRIYVLDTVFEKGIAKNEALSVIDKNKVTISKDSKEGAKDSCDDNLSEDVIQTRGDRTVSFLNNDHTFWESEDDRCVELSEDQLNKIFIDYCCACQNCNFNFCLPVVNRTLTRDEIKRAELGRKYHRLTGHRGRAAEIAEINRGGMKNLNVTVKDLELVDKVFGPCPVCHQAKSFNPKPDISTRIRSIKIGEIQYFDVFFVRGGNGMPQPILIFVDEASRKVLLIKSKTRKTIAIEDGVKLITKWYNSRGYNKPRIIYSDNEKSIKAYSKKFKGRVMFKAAGEHVGVAEAYIGAIKTILRSIIIDLPYNFSLFYLNYLLKEAAMLLSLKPTSTSNGVSIMEAIRGVKPDLEKLKHPFGAYGLATTPSNQLTSDLQEKSEYGLLLSRPATGDLNFRVLLLDSLRVVSRKNFDVLPFNDEIVKRINALSSLDFNKEDPDQLGGDITDGFETDLDSDEIMDLRRVPLHFKNDVTKGIFNNSIQLESTKNVKVDTDFLPTVDPSEVDKLLENQKSFKMEEDIEYGRGRRHITKPELLSLVAEQNQLVKKKIAVEQRMSTRKASVKHGITAENSVYLELKQIVDRGIINPTSYTRLRKMGINKSPIRSFLFNKEKFDLSGMLEKLKARLVAGGNMVDVDDLGDITSPTVKMETVMLLFSLSSYYSYDVSVLDVPCAFLHTKLPESDYTPMIISKEEAEILVKINPAWVEYLLDNGEMLVLVTGGLYGLPQSPKLWYDALTKAIIKLGYKKSAMDPCLFVKIVSESKRSYPSLHVDDIGHFYTHKCFQVELVNMLKKEFTEPTVQSGDEGIYLGLEYKFDRADKSLEIVCQSIFQNF